MNRETYAQRVQEATRSLYYVACTLLAGQADREDALQSCVVKGLVKCETLRDDEKFRPWITKILLNECYSLLRQKKKVVLYEDVPDRPEEPVDYALRDAVLSLKDKYRIPFTLKLEGYTVPEIAQALGIPEGTAKTRLREARRILRDALEDGEEVLA